MPAGKTLNTVMLTLLVACSSEAVFAEGVVWLRSAEKAAAKAKQTGLPILIYVRSETCHYCDLMQKDVWQDPDTAEFIMREFVPLKLTREENKAAVEAMKVKGYPSTLIFSAERNYVGRLDGYLPNDKFLKAISNVRIAAAQATFNR